MEDNVKQRLEGIFQGHLYSPLLFVLMMILINYSLRKSKGSYKFIKSKEKINHHIYFDDIKMFTGMSSWFNGYNNRLQNRSKRVQTPVALLRSLSDKYPWERYEPPYPPSYGYHYCSSRRMALALNNLKRLICH